MRRGTGRSKETFKWNQDVCRSNLEHFGHMRRIPYIHTALSVCLNPNEHQAIMNSKDQTDGEQSTCNMQLLNACARAGGGGEGGSVLAQGRLSEEMGKDVG